MNQQELKTMADGLKTDCGKGLLVGDNLYFAPLNVNGRFIHFSPEQTRFLYVLMRAKGNVQETCDAIGWPLEKATKFFTSRKWREYRDLILASAAVRNGDLRDFWWEFMLDGAKGFQERYNGACELCHQDYHLPPQVAEQYRDDDMILHYACRICLSPVELVYERIPFTPSREQVQCASEIGSRVEPKREHISHSFSEETFSFVTDTEAA